MNRLYALHDSSQELQKKRGSFPVSPEEAERLNGDGYGIFWVVNEFLPPRKTANLERINYWFVECDEGTKEQQLERLRRAPLLPSFVVESKRGMHAYWAALDASLDNWKTIVRWGLVPALGGDPKATDPLRLLRAPGFNHVKDP